jgi:polar amino acid transport system permease protein
MDALLSGPSWSEVLSWLPGFWAGFKLSVQLTVVALVIGLPLGLLLALGVKARSLALRVPCLFLVELGRGAPALVLLQFIYFGLPSAGLPIGAFAAATVALSWTVSAYSSEVIRAGLDAVAAGQREAAIALGLRGVDIYRFVLLPQGLRVATPALMGLSILLFQGTSLCFAISLPEIISRAYDIGANTFHYFPALAIAGLFFAAVCIPAAFLVSWVERRAGFGSRSKG